MKTRILILSIFFVFLLIGTANAFPLGVQFDPDTSANSNYINHTVYGYDAKGQADLSLANITGLDFITEQYFTGGSGSDDVLGDGDTFYENIKLDITNGLDSTQNAAADANGDGSINNNDNYTDTNGDYNVVLDMELNGYIDDYNAGTEFPDATTRTNPENFADDSYTSIFTSGSASMLIDGNEAATFTLSSATQYQFDATSFGTSAQVNFIFQWDTIDSNYFPDTNLQSLIDNEYAFATALDQVFLRENAIAFPEYPDVASQIDLGFMETGADINLNQVPEPTTLLLFGTGLLGLAAFGRKKFMNKS